MEKLAIAQSRELGKKLVLLEKKDLRHSKNALEVKRQAFVAELSAIPAAQIVDLDESGMDNRDQYDYGWNQQGQRFHALKSFSA
jgi:DNA-binding GntR family transcriptional regulator